MSSGGTLELSEMTAEELAGSVVIIDTAVRYLKGDENSSEHMRAFAEDIFRLMKGGATAVYGIWRTYPGILERALIGPGF